MMRTWTLLALLVLPLAVFADGALDNIPEKARPVPPPGIDVPAKDRAELEEGVASLAKEIEDLRKRLREDKSPLLELLPDVQIFHDAVRYALTYNEIYDLKEIATARLHLQRGRDRVQQLAQGKAPWTTAAGLVVRGYVSRIDGSVQPYGLVVPKSYQAGADKKHRLDLWCHGRGEKLTELSFLEGRLRSPGEFTPDNAFVLHLYGRYCNANKFAGEIDGLEALAHVQKHYPIDENRRVIRGFSMGGAACWQFAVHYPTLWAAAAPGAGFSETADFLRVFQNETLEPTGYEKKLWHMYDCTDYARNLFNVPTVAYSGEKDTQKQAADMMEAAMKKEGLTLVHLIGPNTGHGYHPETKKELNERIDKIVAQGRNPVPQKISFTTYTLRYNRSFWVVVEGLETHWMRGRVDAELTPRGVKLTTKGVTALTLSMANGESHLPELKEPVVEIDEQQLTGPAVKAEGAWKAHFRKVDGKWKGVASLDDDVLRKRPGLQGPIDDAFMDSFLMVRPSGKPYHKETNDWAHREMVRVMDHWRKQFRGEVRIKYDDAVSDADIAAHNLILWGDPASNKVLARILDRLPIRWDSDKLHVGKDGYDASQHMPVLIFPNPLNRSKYVVLNSGFTFRDYDYLNNARQIPKLPDFAVIDVRTPPNSRYPGKIVTAGFFDELWRLPEQ
jgi:dienelactone hydrolase